MKENQRKVISSSDISDNIIGKEYKIPIVKFIFNDPIITQRHSRDLFVDENIPQGSIVAEIGVHKGGHADSINRSCKPKELVLVDHWNLGCDKRLKDKFLKYYEDILTRLPDAHVIRSDSVTASKMFEDDYFDAIYIDASHTYEDAYNDLKHWYPKIKKGGLLMGHDFEFVNIPKRVHLEKLSDKEHYYGVIFKNGKASVGVGATNRSHGNGDVSSSVLRFVEEINSETNTPIELELHYQDNRIHEHLENIIEAYEYIIRK